MSDSSPPCSPNRPGLRGKDASGRLVVRVAIPDESSTALVVSPGATAGELLDLLQAKGHGWGACSWQLRAGPLPDGPTRAVGLDERVAELATPTSFLSAGPAGAPVQPSAWSSLPRDVALRHTAQQALERGQAMDALADWQPIKPPKGVQDAAVNLRRGPGNQVAVRAAGTFAMHREQLMSALTAGKARPGTEIAEIESVAANMRLVKSKVSLGAESAQFVCCEWVGSLADQGAVLVQCSVPDDVAAAHGPVGGSVSFDLVQVTPLQWDASQCLVKWLWAGELKQELPELDKLLADRAASTLLAIQELVNSPQAQAAAAEQPAVASPEPLATSSPWDTEEPERAVMVCSQQALDRAAETEAKPNWETMKTPKGAEGCAVSVLVKSKTIVVVRVECEMNASQQTVVDLLRECKGAPKTTTAGVIKQMSDSICLAHIEVSLPIIKNRDFVISQWVDQPAGATARVVRTTVPGAHGDALVPPNAKCVRGRIVLQCTWVTALEGGRCSVKWISCVDPAGKISGAKTMTANEGAKTMAALHKAAVEIEGQL